MEERGDYSNALQRQASQHCTCNSENGLTRYAHLHRWIQHLCPLNWVGIRSQNSESWTRRICSLWTMAMGFVKSTSIRWKASGHCYALGYDHIGEFLKPNCLSIWDFLNLFTTSENSVAIIVRVPSSLDPWNPWSAIVFNVGTHLYAPQIIFTLSFAC